MKRRLLEAGESQLEKIRNFLDNAGPVTVQGTLDGGTFEDASTDNHRQRLEELRQEAKRQVESDKWDARSDALDPLRRKLHDLDLKLNELSKGKFFKGFGFVGLETYTLTEIKKLWKEMQAPEPCVEFLLTLEEAVRANRDFYLQYHDIETLADVKPNEDTSMHNIAMMCRWLHIRVDRVPEIPPNFFEEAQS